MSTISRRKFLGSAGLLGAGAVLADGARRRARADKPLNFSGWVFKPDTVKDHLKSVYQRLQIDGSRERGVDPKSVLIRKIMALGY